MHELVTIKHHPSGKSKKLRGRVVYVPTLIKKRRTEYSVLRRNNLLARSHPQYFVRLFIPNGKNTKYEVFFSTDEWECFTNIK